MEAGTGSVIVQFFRLGRSGLQEDRQQQRSVLDAPDRMRLPRSEVEQLTGREFLRLAQGGKGNLAFQTVDRDLAGGFVSRSQNVSGVSSAIDGFYRTCVS